jgi:hypothetical protein
VGRAVIPGKGFRDRDRVFDVDQGVGRAAQTGGEQHRREQKVLGEG